ncbi:MAG TPA: PAS domain S-box protein [Terriglobales bacterium]|jgi:PAS domain S-box-containing protein|nr:PAS domain S-box protein [Terriglobales bacterium]
MPNQEDQPERLPASQLEKEETRLWRMAMLFVVFLATALAAVTWDRLQSLPYHLGFLPVAVLCVAIFFAAFSYGRRKRMGELKELARNNASVTEAQLDQLGQTISRSQRSFKELIDSFDDIAFAISLDGTVRTVNRRTTEFLDLSYGDVVGHRIFEFVDEPPRAELEQGLPRFLEGRNWSGIVKVRKKNSDRALFFDCAINVIVKDDEVVGASVLARDATGAREKEQRFTELFETLQEGVYFSTPEGRLLEANAALVRMLGYSSTAELVALSPMALNLDDHKSSELGRTAGDHGERTREISLRRKDGSAGIFLDTSRAVWDSSGRVIRYQGTLVDISERRAMEKALQRQEEFQRYLLESFPDMILVVDREERYSFVSARIRDQLGYRPEDLLGKKISDQEQPAQFVALYREVISGEKKFGFCEYDAHHRDGTWRTVRASASPLYDAENNVSGVIMSARDITVEKKLENQIIQSERLAAMGQMIGGFAHELNNPLTSVLGVTELLQDEETSEPIRKNLNILQQQARRAVEIVQNLVYFSRPPEPGRSVINVNELVQRTLHLQAYSLRKNNITVDFLPELSLPTVNGDPHQIMQVFLNLVLNAEQAIREVRDRGTLRIRAGKTDGGVAIVFQDDGPGIPADVVPNIFDPFYTTKRPGRGTGLGLSICKAILREHGGNVEVASGPVSGAVFTVTLPATALVKSAEAGFSRT